MSKHKKKCINCGVWMPVTTKKCPACGFDPSAGDRLEKLPKIRPDRDKGPVQTAILPEESFPKAADPEEPVFDVSVTEEETAPETDGLWGDSGAEPPDIWAEPDGAEKQASHRSDGLTYADYAAEKRKGRRNTWQFIAVLGVIAIIIVVAVILVLKMTEEPAPAETSQTYDTIHILSQDGEELGVTTDATVPEESVEQEKEVVDESGTGEESEQSGDADQSEESEVTEADDTVYVANSGVSLRSGASTTYEVIASLARGVELHRTGRVDGWSRVEYEGETGWVSDSLITTEAPEGSETQTAETASVTAASGTVTVISDANLRKGPGTGYDVAVVAKAGEKLTLIGTSGNWSQVSYNGQALFVSNSLISTGTVAAQATESAAGTVTTNQKANIRSGAGTDYAVLGVADAGTSLSYTGMSGTWYKVDFNGQTGYINRNMVNAGGTQVSEATSGTLTVVSIANVRSGAGTGYDILGIAPEGMEMTFSDHTASNWYEVSFNGQTGYIAGNLISVN